MRKLLLLLFLPYILSAQFDVPNDSSGNAGKISFYEAFTNGEELVSIEAPASIAASFALKWPTALPIGDGCMQVDNTGQFSFAAGACSASGGGVAGADTEIQYNNAGAFGASPDLRLLFSSSNPLLWFGASNTGTTANFEVGSLSTVNTGIIDFHSSGNNIDYDCRLIAFGGSGSIGQGTLRVDCPFQLGASMSVSGDGLHSIATSAARIATGYSDTWNTEFLQIENAGHTAHWILKNESAGLAHTLTIADLGSVQRAEFGNVFTGYSLQVADSITCATPGDCDLGGASGSRFGLINGERIELGADASQIGVIDFFHTTAVGRSSISTDNVSGNVDLEFRPDTNGAVIPDANGVTNFGLIGRRWKTIYAVDLDLSGSIDSLPINDWTIEEGGTGHDLTFDHFGEAFRVLNTGGIQVFGGIAVDTDGTDTIGVTGTRFGGVFADDVDAEILFISDSANHANKHQLDYSSSDLRITFVSSAGDLIPGVTNTHGLGTSSATWLDLQLADAGQVAFGGTTRLTEDFLLLTGDLTTGSGEGAQLIGITKDSASTIEADNFSISADGNFYTRTVAGDVDCATSSVDNGWFGVNTSGNELQFCVSNAARLTPSTPTTMSPVTVNCTAGQSLEDPRFENGILVEGSCVTR